MCVVNPDNIIPVSNLSPSTCLKLVLMIEPACDLNTGQCVVGILLPFGNGAVATICIKSTHVCMHAYMCGITSETAETPNVQAKHSIMKH